MPTSIHNCPTTSWYNFCGQCAVTTCKFNTGTLQSGCLALERRDTDGKKPLSDRELRYYKFENSVTLEYVIAHKKKVFGAVKRVIALYYYSQYVLNNVTLIKINLNKNSAKLLNQFPTRLQELHITPILLANMLLEANFKAYAKYVKLEPNFKLHDLFLVSSKHWSFYTSSKL